MTLHLSRIIFDTEKTGSIFLNDPTGKSDINFLYEGDGTIVARTHCRLAKRLYDLGAEHKAEEIRKVLGVR